ncbi:MAG: hypothetical protein VX467_04825 [Verrucomicrobiota bacterium]|nr:hypothetical protein [Verrucomicrobiota bacterium]
MFHPGGFGDSNGKFQPIPKKQEPSLTQAIFCMVGMLIFWVVSFIVGLKLGMGWYAWPLGTFLLFLFFVVYNFLQFRSSDTG